MACSLNEGTVAGSYAYSLICRGGIIFHLPDGPRRHMVQEYARRFVAKRNRRDHARAPITDLAKEKRYPLCKGGLA